jgi:dihydroorotate dehydrogenase (fumarate)
LLAGADVVMVASVLMKYGPQYMQVLLDELELWLSAREYTSVSEIRGKMSHQNVVNPDEFERVNYIKVLDNAREITSLF